MKSIGTKCELNSIFDIQSVSDSLRKSYDVHLRHPELSSEAYLLEKREELIAALQDKIIIYLDTNHWVNLRHVEGRSERQNPVYSRILDLLRLLRRQLRICCPVSWAQVEELMKQSDTATRVATARLMDELSGGVTLRYWLEMIESEFRLHVNRTMYPGVEFKQELSVWTKVGFLLGESIADYVMLPGKDRLAMQKVWIDFQWNMSVELYQQTPGWVHYVDKFATS